MKLHRTISLIFVLLLIVPMGLMAQEATPEVTPDASAPLGLSDALVLVQAEYPDALILEVQQDGGCWNFEFADGTELCVDELTGEIIVAVDDDSPEATPEAEATPDPDAAAAPAITMEEAIARALEIFPDSTVSKVELETWADGTQVWEVKLDGDSRAVEINAEDGSILDFGFDNNDDIDEDGDGEDDHEDGFNGDDDDHDDGDDNDGDDHDDNDSDDDDDHDDSDDDDDHDEDDDDDDHDDSDDDDEEDDD